MSQHRTQTWLASEAPEGRARPDREGLAQEWLLIHLVRGIEIGKEPVNLAIGKDRDTSGGNVEIPKELARVVDMQRLTYLLALDQDLNLAVLHDGVVDLLALLRPHVADVLWQQPQRDQRRRSLGRS